MRKPTLVFALLVAVLIPATAGAHPERTTFFPDHTKGERPTFPTKGEILTVCKPDSAARVKRLWKGKGKKTSRTRRLRLRQLKRCRFAHIQAAVDAATSGDRIRIFPGVYREEPSLHELDFDPRGFVWIDANDSRSNVFSFLRRGSDGSTLACMSNFSAAVYETYRLGLPHAGAWRELVNTDSEGYGGSGVGNLGKVSAGPVEWHGHAASATVRVPPLATVWLRHEPDE